MCYSNRLLQLTLIVLLLAVSSCVPAREVSPTLYPSVPMTATQLSPTQTAMPDPNNIPPELFFTPTPDPNISTINAEIEQNYSQEKIAKILFSKWLDYLLSEEVSSEMRLDEYVINKINIPFNQRCAKVLGGTFIAEAEVTAKTFLPLASTMSSNYPRSGWAAGGGNIIDSYHMLRSFNGVIYQSGKIYTLLIVGQIPMCD